MGLVDGRWAARFRTESTLQPTEMNSARWPARLAERSATILDEIGGDEHHVYRNERHEVASSPPPVGCHEIIRSKAVISRSFVELLPSGDFATLGGQNRPISGICREFGESAVFFRPHFTFRWD